MNYQLFNDISGKLLSNVEAGQFLDVVTGDKTEQWGNLKTMGHKVALMLYKRATEMMPYLFYDGRDEVRASVQGMVQGTEISQIPKPGFNSEILDHSAKIFVLSCHLANRDPVELLRETFKMSGEKNKDYSPINIIIDAHSSNPPPMTDS